MHRKILMIDNFDSFTYNIVDYFKQCACEVMVYRNTITPEVVEKEDFDLLVLSPGPSTPRNAGNLMKIIAHFVGKKPIFGICLGHQALVEHFGGTLKLIGPQHGKEDTIITDEKTIYTDLEATIQVARYHSLAADEVPACLQISARSGDGTVMSVRHKSLPIEGVQYHPESVLSMRNGAGMQIIRNVVEGKMARGNAEFKNMVEGMMANELESNEIADFVLALEDNQLSEDQKLVLLVSLSFQLKTAGNLAKFMEILQSKNGYVQNGNIGKKGIDICGTGGSGLPRFNTSTLVAVLLAHAGIPIIKHGNKAASGRFGSFDLLEVLGANIDATQAQIEQAFEEQNLAFLYARKTHPLLGALAGARTRLGIPTIFNMLGPLLNPYNPQRQFMGTAFKQFMPLIADTAQLLGKEHFVLVRATDGLDDISISTTTDIIELQDGKQKAYQVSPKDFGIETVSFENLKCHNQNENIAIAKAMLEGKPTTEHYKLVCANAAFIYAKFYNEMPLADAYSLMEDTLLSGDLKTHFEAYCETVKGELVS